MSVESLEVGLEDMEAVALLRCRGVLLAVFGLKFLESERDRIDVWQLKLCKVPNMRILL